MREIRLLWVDDDIDFGPGVEFRLNPQLVVSGLTLTHVDLITDGNFVSDTVRELKPHIVMMDHNLELVTRNGANLVYEVRNVDLEVPIIFYSSAMGPELKALVNSADNVLTSPRGSVESELMSLLLAKFA